VSGTPGPGVSPKALVLLRHGKSDWSAGGRDDRDRPLAKRGRRAAQLAGELLVQARLVPDRAITSPAVRAETTLELAMDSGGWRCPVLVSEELYGGGLDGVLATVQAQPDSASVVLLVGHEPTWSKMVSLLVGGGRHRMPTGALAAITFEVPWRQVGPGTGELAFLLPPRLRDDA
jgi:phosphohistidine phosphatase